jgi:hypothetical protein
VEYHRCQLVQAAQGVVPELLYKSEVLQVCARAQKGAASEHLVRLQTC